MQMADVQPRVTRFINGRVLGSGLPSPSELWVDSSSGRILFPQAAFYDDHVSPSNTVDLQGRIIAPGFLDVQLNGAFGFDLSEVPENGGMAVFDQGMKEMERRLAETGVTAYLPTMTSQRSEVYRKILPHLAPASGAKAIRRVAGAESLGAHCEGPFMSPHRRGCHSPSIVNGIPDCHLATLQSYYGRENLAAGGAIKMVTLAPELVGAFQTVQTLADDGVLVSVGHTEADYETTAEAIGCGATMITHLFNAMNPLHHREPGPYGVLHANGGKRPYFGVIADGIHLHPASIRLAHAAHPDGLILVTDAVAFTGMPDGSHDWLNGQRVRKDGLRITLEGTDTIAGSAVTLIECLNNFIAWTGASIATGVATVTTNPAAMLGLSDRKGTLAPGADADLVILSEQKDDVGCTKLVVDEVWKFGVNIFTRNMLDTIVRGSAKL